MSPGSIQASEKVPGAHAAFKQPKRRSDEGEKANTRLVRERICNASGAERYQRPGRVLCCVRAEEQRELVGEERLHLEMHFIYIFITKLQSPD